jgi:hypothetical protein
MTPISHNCTPNLASDGREISIWQSGKRLLLDRFTLDLLRDATTYVVELDANCDHGYRPVKRSVSLLEGPPWWPNAGLKHVVVSRLRQLGYRVSLWHSSFAPRRLIRRRWSPTPSQLPTDEDFLNFAAIGENFLLRHDSGRVDVAWLIAQAGLGFEDVWIAVLTGTEQEAKSLASRLSRWVPDVALALGNIAPDHRPRVVVGTVGGLAQRVLDFEKSDVLFVPNALQGITYKNEFPILQVDSRFRLIGFLRSDIQTSRQESDRLITTFGPWNVEMPAHGHYPLPVSVAWQRIHAPAVADIDSVWALKRAGYIEHAPRNRRIASLAETLVLRIWEDVNRLSPGLAALSEVVCEPRVVVVSDTIDHVLRLAEHLPDWPVFVPPGFITDGLPPKFRRILAERNTICPSGPLHIATLSALADVDLADVDVLIWAGGGKGRPVLRASNRIVHNSRKRQLILVDVIDAHNPTLLRWSRRRRRQYDETGWFPPGTDQYEAAIARFWRTRPRIGAQVCTS